MTEPRAAALSDPTQPMTPLGRSPSESRPSEEPTPPDSASFESRLVDLVERDERASFQRRLSFALFLGAFIWLCFGLLDFLAVSRGLGDPKILLVQRAVPFGVALGAAIHLRYASDPSWGLMRLYESLAFGVAAFVTGTHFGMMLGFESGRVPSAVLIIMVWTTAFGSHWRRSIIPVVTMVLAVPAGIFAVMPISERLQEQFARAEVMEVFAVHYLYVIAGGLIALLGGHAFHQLRQQVRESRSVGRYQLRSKIASGGMGEVWAAYHAALKRDVAVKLIHVRPGFDQRAVERFEREVRTLAELTHPNTIRVFDYGATAAGVWYYAMELLDGENLQQVIAREGAMDPQRAIRLVAQAAEAVAEAHTHGIVHRDIKPANLVLVQTAGAGEYVKLIDFGIARDANDDSALTATGMVIGTPGYIAPEILSGASASSRADVFSLGAVLYALVTGVAPHRARTPAEALRATLEPPEAPSRYGVGISAALDEVVLRCLARDPEARFADGAEVARALRELV